MKRNAELSRTRESERTREALLDAGLEVFAEKGFAGAKVDEIARRARVNKAMISYHFGGKRGLYKEILHANFSLVEARMRALMESTEPASTLLRRFIEGFGGLVASRPTLPAMMLREVLSGGAHLDDDLLPDFLSVFAIVREIITRGIREGEFRAVNPLLTHLGLIGGLVFFFATGPFRERLAREGILPVKSPESPEFIRHMQEFAVRALAARPVRTREVPS